MATATLPATFEVRNTGVFSVICLKSEPKFTVVAPKPAKKSAPAAEDSDDDVDDLFGDDGEDEDIAIPLQENCWDKELQARMKAKAEKAKKRGPEKMFVFDKTIWHWNGLGSVSKKLKATTLDGIVCWGQEQVLPVAFGIKKLRISMIVEDDKLCQDDLEDHINADGRDDEIQSIDLYTMSKV